MISPEQKRVDAQSEFENSSAAITAVSERHIAGGVVSLNRKADPAIVFASAQGSYLFDTDGQRYLDYHAAFAPHLLGHNHPEINGAVLRALEAGWSLFGSGATAWEARLAELLCQAVASLERVQIVNTGSEASAYAIRLARAYTGRDDIITPLGGYNGWHDDVGRAVMPTLAQVGPRVSPGEYPFVPISAGIPHSTQQRIHCVNFNDLDSVEYVLRRHSIACVLLEPVLQNIGVVLPQPGYLAGLRTLCDQYGALLIFDEVKTGFRSAPGGYQAIAGVRPDLSIFGKAVANGYPLGVIGGRQEVMDLFGARDPQRRVLIAGTYNGHPINVAAAIATLEVLMRDHGAIYQTLEQRSARLCAGISSILREADLPSVVVRNASAFCWYFAENPPQDWHAILASHNFALDTRLRLELIKRGVYFFPLACKQGSVSAAHSEGDIDQTLALFAEAVAASKA
jgi:glutamate-1-semialdehyde 2,1-aminomutase